MALFVLLGELETNVSDKSDDQNQPLGIDFRSTSSFVTDWSSVEGTPWGLRIVSDDPITTAVMLLLDAGKEIEDIDWDHVSEIRAHYNEIVDGSETKNGYKAKRYRRNSGSS